MGELTHPIQHSVDVMDDILSIHKDRLIFGSTQSHVQHRSLFGDVDLLPAEHGVDPLAQTGLCCKLEKKLESLICNTILGVVDVKPHCLYCHALPALGVVCE